MNHNSRNLIKLLRSQFNNNEVQSFIVSNWDELLSFIGSHHLMPQLLPIIKQMEDSFKPTNKSINYWDSKILVGAVQQVQMYSELNKVISSMEIDFNDVLVLKGVAIDRFYNDSFMRFSTDIDFLVKPISIHAFISRLKSSGYTERKGLIEHEAHDSFYNDSGILVEVHHTISNIEYLGGNSVGIWLLDVFNRSITVDHNDLHFRAMSIEDEFIHQISHFTKHFVLGEATYRNIYDIALIVSKCDSSFDWEYILRALNHMKLTPITVILMTLCERNLNIKMSFDYTRVSDEVIELLVNQMDLDMEMTKIPFSFKAWSIISKRIPIICRHPRLRIGLWGLNNILQIFALKGNIKESFHISNKIKLFHSERIAVLEKLLF